MTNLLIGNWAEGNLYWVVVAAIAILIILYYLIQWIRSTRNYRDSADDHARGCLDTLGLGCLQALGIGCLMPLTVVVLLVTTFIF